MCPSVRAHWRHQANTIELVASFGSPESTTQAANQWFRPFLNSSQQEIPIFYNGRPTRMAPSHGGSGPHLIYDSLGLSKPTPKWHLDWFSLFTQMTVECPYTLQWEVPSPPKLPLSMRDLDPISYMVPWVHPT